MTTSSIPDIPLKRCKKCGIEKPARSDYFRVVNDNCDGFSGECLDCKREGGKRYRESHKKEIRESDRAYQKSHLEGGRAKSKRWRDKHLDESRQYAREYDASHRLIRCEARRERHKTHPEVDRLYAATHREERRVTDAAWRAAHPEKARAFWHRRRARKAGNGGTHTGADIRLQIKAQTDKKGRLHCWYCSGIITGNEYHIDHRIPLAKGGSNAPENLCIACPSCNLSKGAKLPQEWNGRLL